MATFNGQLRSNEIYSALFNMIISQRVFADNIQKHQTLVDEAKEEAGLYGDTKLYYSADVIGSHPWGATESLPKGGYQDAEAGNLLSLDRPKAPECQALIIDTFRQVRLTTDEYMSKRAWADEAAFADFTSVMIGMLDNAKRVYEGTLYNVFIGNTVASGSAQTISLGVDAARANASSEEEANRLEAEAIAQGLANLLVELGDYNRKFNDYGHMRSYADENIKVIWNSEVVNKIKKTDLPTIFHKEGLVDKFDENVMPAKYFGRAIKAEDKGEDKVINASGEYDPSKGTILSKVEKFFTISNVEYHVFPGEKINCADQLAAGDRPTVTVKAGGTFEESEVYIQDDSVVAKVVVKLPPMLSAFSVGTSFYNARALLTNRYLTWGHSTLEYLKNYPFITLTK